MDRRVIVVVVAVGCGPAVGVDQTSGGGSGDGDTTSTAASDDDAPATASDGGVSSGVDSSGPTVPAVCSDGVVDANEECDDGNADDLDGCDSQCRVTGPALWDLPLPMVNYCPRLAALDDGGVAIIGNEGFTPDASIPHVLVVESDGIVRWTFQGGHAQYDVATDLIGEPGGFVVVGHGDAAGAGWMQRWTADGSQDAEAIFGMDELGDRVSEVERRDAGSYWVVGTDEELGPRSLHFRSFEVPPASAIPLIDNAVDVKLARAPDEGVYVSADAEVGTLTRVDRDGAVIWTTPYAARGGALPFTFALASTPSGDAIVVGTDQGPSPHTQWVRRVDADGAELWRVPLEVTAVPSDDIPMSVTTNADSIFVVGWSYADGGNDGFLAKYDEDGAELWQSIWGGEGDVRPCEAVATTEGVIVVAGSDEGENPQAYWLRAYAE